MKSVLWKNGKAIEDAKEVLEMNLSSVTPEQQDKVIGLLYSIHNQKNRRTNCGSCMMNRINEIHSWLQTEEKKLINEYKPLNLG